MAKRILGQEVQIHMKLKQSVHLKIRETVGKEENAPISILRELASSTVNLGHVPLVLHAVSDIQ